MTRRRKIILVVTVALLAVAALTTTLVRNGMRGPVELTSAEVVYCVDPEHSNWTLQAAIVRGNLDMTSSLDALRSDNRTYRSLLDWRMGHADQFRIACRDSIATGRIDVETSASQTSPIPSSLAPFLGVLLGALLTLIAGEWRSARDALKARVNTLRACITAFDVSVRRYLTEWMLPGTAAPSTQEVQQRALDLQSLLASHSVRGQVQNQSGDAVTDLVSRINPNNWPPAGAARAAFARDEQERLDEVVRALHAYAEDCGRWRLN